MYRYETHLHTSLVSACSMFTPREIVEKYKRLGYSGVFVTDHFLNGNTCVPRDLPWRERIARYEEGYHAVMREAKDGLRVFFGFESSYHGTDFLIYGLDGAWLSRHPEMLDMKPSDLLPFLHRAGGLVVQAHPYREASYIDHIRLFPSVLDAIETVNACRTARENRLADILADEYGLKKTAGSDIHFAGQALLAGMEFDRELTSERDFCDCVLKGEGRIFTLIEKE